MRRTSALAGAFLVTAGLTFGAGVALAAPADPEPCAALVAAQDSRDRAFVADSNADQRLDRAQGELETAQAALEALQDRRSEFTAAESAQREARVTLEGLLAVAVGDQNAEAIAAARLELREARAAAEAIDNPTDEEIAAAQNNVTEAQSVVDEATTRATDTQSALDQAQTVLNGVQCPTDQAPTTPEPSDEPSTVVVPISPTVVNYEYVVNPIDDDDSTADVDGSQVTVVPEGSAQTGEA